MIRTLVSLGIVMLAGAVMGAPPVASVVAPDPKPKETPTPVTKPRGAAFGSSVDPLTGPSFRRPPTAKVEPRISDAFDMIVFAKHRPIKLRITVVAEGKSMTDRWRESLKTS